MTIMGYQREDGRIGIRNRVMVLFTVICAEQVANRIAWSVPDAFAVGWRDCQEKDYATRKMVRIGTHPNIGGVLVVSLGCECSDAADIGAQIAATGKPVDLLVIQEAGGTKKAIRKGIEQVRALQETAEQAPRVAMSPADLIVGVECGGSDATSGLAANPAVGVFSDRHIARGGTVIFEETNELWGCEPLLLERADTPTVADAVRQAVEVSRQWSLSTGQVALSTGNIEGGLTTIEEKSLGAFCKAGSTPIKGVLQGGEWNTPDDKGLYLLAPFYVEPNGFTGAGTISDPNGVTELAAAGAHIVIFTTGRGSVTGSGVAPVIKVTGNDETYHRMQDNMDINAGTILTGERTLEEVGETIDQQVLAVAEGALTKAEDLEHFEFHI
jgi:altronate hydrolase